MRRPAGIVYKWRSSDGRVVTGEITYLNRDQLQRDEFTMTLDMMKAGWSLIKRTVRYVEEEQKNKPTNE